MPVIMALRRRGQEEISQRMYGNLIRTGIDGNVAEVLKRVPLGAGVSDGGVSEAVLQDLLFRIPQALPVSSIDTAYSGAVSICRELSTPAGFTLMLCM